MLFRDHTARHDELFRTVQYPLPKFLTHLEGTADHLDLVVLADGQSAHLQSQSAAGIQHRVHSWVTFLPCQPRLHFHTWYLFFSSVDRGAVMSFRRSLDGAVK